MKFFLGFFLIILMIVFGHIANANQDDLNDLPEGHYLLMLKDGLIPSIQEGFLIGVNFIKTSTVSTTRFLQNILKDPTNPEVYKLKLYEDPNLSGYTDGFIRGFDHVQKRDAEVKKLLEKY